MNEELQHELSPQDQPPDMAQPEAEPGDGFAELGLGPETLRAVTELGFEAPTPIQEQTVSVLLGGRDLIAQAPTGTGKTAAYGLPIIERLDEDELCPQALVVVPTRELAIQVAQALHGLGKYHELVAVPIYGGQAYDRQFQALRRGVQVVVGTPGRLLDHLGRGTLDLSSVRTVVLDEADEMLNMGFIEDIEAILAQAPPERQTALFSATMPPRVAQLAQRYLNDPVRVSVAIREAVAPQVRQVFYEVPTYVKPDALVRVLDHEEPESAIVFVRTRRDADEVAEKLSGRGYVAQAIHGDLSQSQRERVLGRFRLGHTQLLVATDVAARGLDIPEVSHVINYHLPEDPQIYVHRIGRTGRAGRSGQALTLVTPRERRQLRLIEQATRSRPERLPLPTAEDVAKRRRAAFRQEVLRILDAGQLDPFVALVEDLADTRDPAELAAAAFKMAAQARGSGGTAQARSRTQSPDSPTALDVAPIPGEGQLHAEDRARPARRSDDRGTFDGGTQDGTRVRIFLRVGHRDNIRPADLVGAIANEAGVPGHVVGDIDIYDTFSFVDVPADLVNQVLGALNQTMIRGREPRAVIARPAEESLERNTRQGPRGRFPQRGPRPGGRDGGDNRDARRGRFTAGPVRRTGRDSDFQRRPPSGDR